MTKNINKSSFSGDQPEKADKTGELTEKSSINFIHGNTTFLIGLHFASKGRETFADKAKRLIGKEVKADNF